MKPKYSVLVQDLNADQARRLINELDGGDFFVGASMSAKNETVQQPAATQSPAPAAPVQPAAQSPIPNVAVNVQGIELDSKGLPWDERIHASTKAINKDGSWKAKRGVQPVTVTEVEAELRNTVASQNAQVSAPAAAPVQQFAPPAPQAPAAPVAMPQPAPVAAPTRDFQGLMLRISQLFSAQQIAPEYPNTIVDRINKGFGITLNTVTDVANDTRYVEYAWQCLEVDGKAA
jgi:hypothetical protein